MSTLLFRQVHNHAESGAKVDPIQVKSKQNRRARTVPRNIGEKTGREIMETVFGKRVMREIHSRLDAQNYKPAKGRHQESAGAPVPRTDTTG